MVLTIEVLCYEYVAENIDVDKIWKKITKIFKKMTESCRDYLLRVINEPVFITKKKKKKVFEQKVD